MEVRVSCSNASRELESIMTENMTAEGLYDGWARNPRDHISNTPTETKSPTKTESGVSLQPLTANLNGVLLKQGYTSQHYNQTEP